MVTSSSEFAKPIRHTDAAKSVNRVLKDWYARSQEARAKGAPSAWVMASTPPEILEAFDIQAVFPENYGAVSASRGQAVHYINIAESEGYSPSICSYCRNTLGYIQERQQLKAEPPDAPLGGMGDPSMLLSVSLCCDIRIKWFQTLATRYLKVPIHIMESLNPPYGLDMTDERIKKHYIDVALAELRSLVAFLEEQTGRKLDERRLKQVIANSLVARRLLYQTYQLRKAVPSPMPSEDAFACVVPYLYMRGTSFAVDFYQKLHEEVKERVEKRIAVIPEERYRILWVGMPPWFNMGIFNYLESLGTVSAIESQYYMGTPIEVDPEKGLQALAEIAWLRSVEQHRQGAEIAPEQSGPSGDVAGLPVSLVESFARDYKVHGIIVHLVQSCRIISFGQAHYKNVLRERLNLPMLSLESDMSDPRLWNDTEIKGHIKLFIDVLGQRKGTTAVKQ
ncbi:MAG: 2-hydroxyacyl-CoA dehydratase [Chloroflexi bacterium]|nr:2-hydroxyacyl-CoA dehydratase [Chloroflexota bacterium]